MNITGQQQYSSSILGLRQPEKLSENSSLVFIYPILIANKIKAETSMPLETVLRDFLSITFLKEVFIQNTISIIKMANQIQPLADEGDEVFDANATHLKVAKSMGVSSGHLQFDQGGILFSGGDTRNPSYKINPQHAGAVQQKIKEKTAVITRHLKTDPKFIPLRPFVEIVTLGNLIDVPVIVGTKPQHILLTSIILKKPLFDKSNKKDNLDEICAEIEKLTPEKYWTLLNNLLPKSEPVKNKMREQLEQYLSGNSNIQSAKRMLSQAYSPVSKVVNKISEFGKASPDYNSMFDILNTIKSKLNETKLFLRFALDPKLMKSQYNIDPSVSVEETSKRTDIQISPELDRFLRLTSSNFERSVNTTGLLPLHSVFNALYPDKVNEYGLPPDNINFTQLKKTHIDEKMMPEIEEILSVQMGTAIINAFSKNTEDLTKNQIKSLKDLSGIDLTAHLKEIDDLFVINDLGSRAISWNDWQKFSLTMDKIASNCSGLNSNFERIIKALTIDSGVILRTIRSKISSNLTNLFLELSNQYSPNIVPRLFMVASNNTNANVPFTMQISDIQQKLIPNFVDYLTEIYYFLFLYQFQHTLFNIIRSAEIELQTVSSDVTTWPNYTLVLPVEIVTALHAAVVSKSWSVITRSQDNTPLSNEELGQRNIISPSDSYIKGIVKYVSRALDVPNLIVVDGKKKEVYYKLMHNDAINKTKLSTLETFVKTNLDTQF